MSEDGPDGGTRVVFDRGLRFGDVTPRTLGNSAVEVRLPGGVPTDAPIRVIVVRKGAPAPTAAKAPRIRLRPPHGAAEDVPILAAGGRQVTAVRRPPVRAAVVLGLLGAVIVLWIFETVPLFVTSLSIPVVLCVAGVAPARTALAPFFDPIIVLFLAGFLMAVAMRRVGLDRWAAVSVVARAGTSPVRLYAAMIAVSAFLSMWMSNTAAVAVLIPVALAVTAPLDSPGFRKASVLGIAYAATIGGVGSAIGTPANQLAIRFVDDLVGRSISFLEWFAFGLPLVLLFLPVMALYLWRVSDARVDPDRFAAMYAEAQAQRRRLGGFNPSQRLVLLVFGGVAAGWLTQQWHGVNAGIVALAGAVALFAVRRLEPSDLGRISWATLITFGGGLVLGDAMVSSGTADWLIARLGALHGLPSIAAVAVVAAFTLVLTTVASNTGAAATLVPLSIPLAGVIGVSPVLLAAAVAIASSIDFALVIGTPPTMLAYDTGLFSVREILRKGALLDLVGLLLLATAVTALWQLIGLV